MTVANDSGKEIGYGEPTSIESVRTGRTVRVKGLSFALPLFTVAPRTVGMVCDSVFVPSSVKPGLYRAVLGVTDLPGRGKAQFRDVTAEFRVQGPPIPHPKWEAVFRRNVLAK